MPECSSGFSFNSTAFKFLFVGVAPVVARSIILQLTRQRDHTNTLCLIALLGCLKANQDTHRTQQRQRMHNPHIQPKQSHVVSDSLRPL